MNGIVFDAGGLIALDKNDRRILAIIDMALKEGARFVVPATALAQAIRNPVRQARLWRLIHREETEIVPLDGSFAQKIGVLLAKTGASDVVDAHVAVCAREEGYAVITSDPFDLKRLDPALRLVSV